MCDLPVAEVQNTVKALCFAPTKISLPTMSVNCTALSEMKMNIYIYTLYTSVYCFRNCELPSSHNVSDNLHIVDILEFHQKFWPEVWRRFQRLLGSGHDIPETSQSSQDILRFCVTWHAMNWAQLGDSGVHLVNVQSLNRSYLYIYYNCIYICYNML